MNKKILLCLIAVGIGAGITFQPQVRAGLGRKLRKAAKRFRKRIKKAAKKVGKGIKKAGKKVGKFTKNVANKVKHAGQDAINFARNLGEDVWDKLQGFPDCVKIPVFASEFAAEKAAYETTKTALKGTSQFVSGIGDITEAVGKVVSMLATKGIVIEEIFFEASVEQLLKAKTPRFKIVGKVGGKKFKVDVQFDANPTKFAKKILKSILKKIKI